VLEGSVMGGGKRRERKGNNLRRLSRCKGSEKRKDGECVTHDERVSRFFFSWMEGMKWLRQQGLWRNGGVGVWRFG
jgi:hypothetical protein